jgi:CBS domain containing-hemolysin-like protein
MEIYLLVLLGLVTILVVDLLTIAARTGLRNATLARVLQLHDQGVGKAEDALALMDMSPRPYAGLHLLQSLARFLLFGGILLFMLQSVENLAQWAVIVILLLIGLIVALTEWVVERLIVRNPEVWVIRLNAFIRFVNFAFYPLASLALLFTGETKSREEYPNKVTEDELITLVDASEQNGIIEQEERQMIRSIIQLGETLTREIMVPRIDIIALDVHAPLSEAMDKLVETGFSRLPVYEETVDNIIGLLYAKDLISLWRDGKDHDESLRDVLREAYFVPEAKKADELLSELQSRRVHMAIVVDEYGGVAGVVTLEDIIEEIFGEIQDEYDENEEMLYQIQEDGSYLFRGRVDLDDFNDLMNTNLPVDEADTLGGFLYMRFGHVPIVGEHVEEDGLHLTVVQVSSRRIRLVRAQRIPQEEKTDVDGKTS